MSAAVAPTELISMLSQVCAQPALKTALNAKVSQCVLLVLRVSI